MKELFPYIKFISQIVPVGSRVTCDPAPTDTDEDYLVLLNETVDNLWDFAEQISGDWDVNSNEAYETIDDDEAVSFFSARCGELNIIVTMSHTFFVKFLVATKIAKKLNLMNKEDRVKLFQTILYEDPHDDISCSLFGEVH